MRLFLVFVVFGLLVSADALAQVYRWVDAEGVVHYSDQPQASAEEVDIDVPEGIANPTRIVREQPTPAPQQPEASAGSTPIAYESVTIRRPEPQQVLWNIATRLPVEIALTPSLSSAHRIQLMLDGQPVGEPSSSTQTVVEPVYRGEHTLTAIVLDAEGNAINRSPPVVFYVQQATRGGR